MPVQKQIPITGEELESSIDKVSGAYATKFKDIPESYKDYTSRCKETYRTRFRRDKDRILYSKSFRRLQHKTQVIASDAADHQRTRLLHTLEVQQLAGSISDALLANTDLSEAIALGHDLGHTPFGHAGERALDRLLDKKGCGGFSHAIQSLRILSKIEKHQYAEQGLGISDEVLSGILKHDADVFAEGYSDNQSRQFDCSKFRPTRAGGIESQIVYWSDKLAYLSHDWEDFIRYCYQGIVKNYDKSYVIKNDLTEIRKIWEKILPDIGLNGKNLHRLETRDIIRKFNSNLISTTKSVLDKEDFQSSQKLIDYTNERFDANVQYIEATNAKDLTKKKKAAYQDSLVVNLSDDYREYFRRVREFLDKYYIHDSSIIMSDTQGERIIETLFIYYTENPKALEWDQRVDISGKLGDQNDIRIIADHIAGMTDRYAISIYNRIIGVRGV